MPPRLYHVISIWVSPVTTQLRSSVCPSATAGNEDSIRTGGVLAPEAGIQERLSKTKRSLGWLSPFPSLALEPPLPGRTTTWILAWAVPVGLVATQR